MLPPSLRQGFHLHHTTQQVRVGPGVSVRVEMNDVRDGDVALDLVDALEGVAGGDLAFLGDGEVEAGADALEELVDDVVEVELQGQLEAGGAGLGDDEFGRAGAE